MPLRHQQWGVDPEKHCLVASFLRNLVAFWYSARTWQGTKVGLLPWEWGWNSLWFQVVISFCSIWIWRTRLIFKRSNILSDRNTIAVTSPPCFMPCFTIGQCNLTRPGIPTRHLWYWEFCRNAVTCHTEIWVKLSSYARGSWYSLLSAFQFLLDLLVGWWNHLLKPKCTRIPEG